MHAFVKPWAGAALGLSILPACAAPPPPADPEHLDRLHAVDRIEIPASLRLEPKTRDIATALGESAVFSLQLHTGDDVETWFVRTTIVSLSSWETGTITQTQKDGTIQQFKMSGTARFHVRVTDAQGQLISESLTDRVPRESLDLGFFPMCEHLAPMQGAPVDARHRAFRALPQEEQRKVMISMSTFQALFALVSKNESLAPLLDKAIRRPSLLTIALNLAKGIGIEMGDDVRIWTRPTPIEVQSAYVTSLRVTAYGDLALDASALAVRATRPTRSCAGIVSLVGVHPGNPANWVHLQLQALGRVDVGELARILPHKKK